MSTRWPVHPAPVTGEALTSWLRRIAHRYGAEVEDLVLDTGFCISRPGDLDVAAPEEFINQLAGRTRTGTDTIRAMTLGGQTPWLLDQLEPAAEAYTTYTRQLAVLLPRGRRRDRTVEDWRAWFRLALAYDAAGDRKRARRAMRDAVALDRGRPAHHLADGEG